MKHCLGRKLSLQLTIWLLLALIVAPVGSVGQASKAGGIISIAPDEFLFIGSNLTPSFALDGAGTRVVIASKDEGRYEKGKWIPDRRLNGDEARRGLPNGTIGMLKVKVVRIPN